MLYNISIPIILGFTFSCAVNYFADLLPFTFRLTRPSCHIEGCSTQFSWFEYIFLRRCKTCCKRSYSRYLIVIVLSIAFSLLFWSAYSPNLKDLLYFLAFYYLLIVGLIDLEHHLILLPLNISGLLILGVSGIFLHGWMSTLVGGLAGAVILYSLYLLGKLFTRYRAKRLNLPPGSLEDSLAFGDVILVLLLGLFLGWPNIWFGLLLGFLLAGLLSFVVIIILALRKKYKEKALSIFIPLGPGFIIATMTIVYFPIFFSFF